MKVWWQLFGICQNELRSKAFHCRPKQLVSRLPQRIKLIGYILPWFRNQSRSTTAGTLGTKPVEFFHGDLTTPKKKMLHDWRWDWFLQNRTGKFWLHHNLSVFYCFVFDRHFWIIALLLRYYYAKIKQHMHGEFGVVSIYDKYRIIYAPSQGHIMSSPNRWKHVYEIAAPVLSMILLERNHENIKPPCNANKFVQTTTSVVNLWINNIITQAHLSSNVLIKIDRSPISTTTETYESRKWIRWLSHDPIPVSEDLERTAV